MNLNPDQSPQTVQPSSPTPPPVETVVPPQGSTPPPGQKQSIFANKLVIVGIVLLFLIPIVLALGYFFVFQKNTTNEQGPVPTVIPIETSAPTPTTAVDITLDWETYTSTQSAFLIKYPKENFVRLSCPGEDLVLRTRQAADTKDVEVFETCGRGGRMTIEAFAAATLTEPTTDEYVNVVEEDITVAGVTARKYVTTKKPGVEGPIPDYSEDIYLNRGGKTYLIHFDKGVTDEIKNAMLDSFKFTQ